MIKDKSLALILLKIEAQGANVIKNDYTIKICINFTKFHFLMAKPLLYLLLNKFENSYFILIEGLPYCLMADASNHIIYARNAQAHYVKKKACSGCKYEDHCPGWPHGFEIADNIRPTNVKNLPKEIVLEITQKCNQDCLLCFSKKKNKEMPLEKIREIIEDCYTLGIKAIRFTGGEPLLYKDLEKALQYAKEKNLYVMLNTNATVLDEKNKGMLKKYVENLLISLQGFNHYTEEKLTKTKVNFKEKITNIMALHCLVPTVRIGTIITNTFLNNLHKYYFLIRKLRIPYWELYRPMANDQNEEFIIEGDHFLKIMLFIKQLRKTGIDIKIANPIPFCITSDLALSSFTLLGAEADDGHSRIIMDSAGFYKPSYSINRNLGVNITEAWQNLFLQKIRSLSFLPEKCKKCFYLKWCKGGSRYWAKKINNDYFSFDPLMKND